MKNFNYANGRVLKSRFIPFVCAAAFGVQFTAFAQTAKQPELPTNPAEVLPKIAPGEYKEMSIDQLPEASKRFFLEAADKTTIKNTSESKYRLIEAAAQELTVIKNFAGRVVPDILSTKIDVVLSTLQRSPLAKAEFLGYVLENQSEEKQYRRVSRLFKLGRRSVMLSEWNFAASGGGVIQLSEFVNAKVAGSAAILTVKRDTEGAALWNLTWGNTDTDRQLYVFEDRFDPNTADLLLSLAESLSAKTPSAQ